jgi:hypothetical protein
MVSIDSHLRAIKSEPSRWLDSDRIVQLCRENGYFPEADGSLPPARLLGLFMRQIAAGNVPCEAVRLMGDSQFSPSGYCQARMRLPLAVIESTARQVSSQLQALLDDQPKHRWHGHRVLLIDASSFSMPDEPELQAHFGQPGRQKAGCGFPVAHWLMLFNARTGLAVDTLTAPLRTHEASQAAKMHERLSPGDLVVGDDSFGTYALFATFSARGAFGLFPLHHRRITGFTPGRSFTPPAQPRKQMPRSRWIKSLGKDDQQVEWFKPGQKPKWMSAQQWQQIPESIIVRELRRTIPRPGFRPVTLTVATTLLDPVAYPADELMALRIRRWDVETDLRHLKTTMGMDVLRCKTVDGVKKELWIFLLIYNLIRVVMIAAAERQQVPISRISFASALQWLRYARVGDALPALAVTPHRPNRMEPRVIKRRAKEYDLMTRPRSQLREKLKAQIGEQTQEKPT